MKLNKQSGFTLVEIAIVLVIIGLLLGGVLKGQEMIESARVKNAIADLNGISVASNSYRDRYRRQAGDDGPPGGAAGIAARGGPWVGWNAARSGNVDGALTAPVANIWNAAASEKVAFFAQLRAAGFLSGNPALVGVAALPVNSFGGLTSVASIVVPAVAVLNNMNGNIVCMSNVPGKAAAALDAAIDDGVGNSGAVRNTIGGANTVPAASVAAYVETNQYTICREL